MYASTLFYGLHSFHAPSAQAKQKLQTGRVKRHNKETAVDKKEQEFVLKISEDLVCYFDYIPKLIIL